MREILAALCGFGVIAVVWVHLQNAAYRKTLTPREREIVDREDEEDFPIW